jgi:hypothetical protein
MTLVRKSLGLEDGSGIQAGGRNVETALRFGFLAVDGGCGQA